MIKPSSATAFILLLSLMALSTAEPLRRRFSARQVEAQAPASPTPTGYPEAGVTPEVPFDLPSSTAKPDVTYLPPDNTYGPPDNTYGPPDNTYGPPATADVEPGQEPQPEDQPEYPIETDDIPPVDDEALGDAKQQPAEDEEEEVLVQVSDDGTVIAVSSSLDQPQSVQSARLYQRFPQGRRREQPVPQRLILRRSW
ncbi:GL25275 [Drosophila persimilis]|uniref:GL25275 n=1 Tax=Drosophila persimilis TaxID=7234 RepID=B4GRW3_DROPE|nr:uncharacterized protein LOC6595761 [Drosophila persimilis]EDW40498.1 GL25275 [Drosophila persimilis]